MAWIYVYLANLLLSLVAWYVTKRHLWTNDLFAILFSFGLCSQVVLKTFSIDESSEETD
jgi:hypothetical protein